MIFGARRAFFQREPIDMSGVEAVDCRPAIRAVTDVGRNAFFSRDANETRNEAVIAITMHRGREAQDGHVHAARCE